MAFVKMYPKKDDKIKWIIKDGVEKANRLLTSGVQNTAFHTEGYLEFISTTTQSIDLVWDVDTTKYSKLHVTLWSPGGDPVVGRSKPQVGAPTYDRVDPGTGGNFANPKVVNITFTSEHTDFNNPKVGLGRWGASNWHINIINMWVEK